MNFIAIAKPRPGAGNAIRAELTASDRATAKGITAHGPAPVLVLCRKLLLAGHDPAAPLIAYRATTLCLRIRAIGEGARLTVDEHNGTRFAAWKRFYRSAGSPRIAQKLARVP